MVPATRVGATAKMRKKKRRKKGKEGTTIPGGKKTGHTGRRLSRTVKVSVRIGPNGGVPMAVISLKSLQVPSGSLIQILSHLLSDGPRIKAPTKTTEML